MSWLGRGSEGGDETRLRSERIESDRRIAQAMAAREWGSAYDDLVRLHKHYRDTSRVLPVTQSELATLHGRLGLVMIGQRRLDEAHQDLVAAEQLFNMEPEAATAWAGEQGIQLEGVGEEIDYRLALEVLQALADSAVRRGQSDVGQLLSQVVAVADTVGHAGRRWEARAQLAAFTAGLSDWESLLEIAREMGGFAFEQRNLVQLLAALRYLVEAHIGMRRPGQALAAQELVVEIARHLGHGDLTGEQEELERIRAVLAP